ncbi:sugar kinase [Maritalea myrionectae]|uniref:2-dehydro-3-deoxygluconokinase n=1 Tax=Maritalea myrionectae TaxID=454601 RepID=A0A2R4MG86_9HYPH|nr:sugar kinase [Maritalea myrionectae]AVX05057.1 2-dehydro-3-deoxygluconokinase [Maritalea myrionectae]
MTKLISIGECMIEMSALEDGLYKKGYAGDSLNMAYYARSFLPQSFDVDYFTALGDDVESEALAKSLERHGIGTDLIKYLPGKSPGLYMISLDNGERMFSYWRSASAAKEMAQDIGFLERTLLGDHALFFSGISLAILQPDTRAQFLDVLNTAKENGQQVIFDSNLRPSLWQNRQEMADWTAKASAVCTMALPTVPDEYVLFDEKSSEQVAERYLRAGCTEIVVKAGPEDALLTDGQQKEWVGPGQSIQPVDTTGAGDSFNGGYIAARLSGKNMVDAAQFAHKVAGQVIQHRGALVADIKSLVK